MKSVLVTGGVGFVGTNLIRRLLNEGCQVISVDNYEVGTVENEHDGATYLQFDVRDDLFTALQPYDIDVVYHLAALSRIQPSFENPTETVEVNTNGTLSVLEWARSRNIKVIYAGSSSRWHNPFISPYALSKHMGEELCKTYRTIYNMEIEITRFYNVYGPREITEGDWAAVIGKWRGQVERGELITIVGDGEQRRDFTHIDDIVDGLIRIGQSNERHHDAWELGTGNNYSLNEVYHMFRDKFKVGFIRLPDQQGNYKETRRENNDAVDRLGWTPNDRLREYINNL